MSEILKADENQLRNFVMVIDAAVCNVDTKPSNNGQLWESDDNMSRVIYEVRLPNFDRLPASIGRLASFDSPQVTVTATRSYGQGLDKLAFWTATPTSPAHSNLRFGATYFSDSAALFSSPEAYNSAVQQEPETMTEDELGLVTVELMPEIEDIRRLVGEKGVLFSFMYGLEQMKSSPNTSAIITSSVGQKNFPAGIVSNGFQCSARVISDRRTGEATKTITVIDVDRFFTGAEIGALWGGRLAKTIKITTSDTGEVSEAKKMSSVSLMDELSLSSYGSPQAFSSGNPIETERIPTKLREHAYDSDVVTVKDLEYFLRIITQPVADEDIAISA